MFSEPSTTMVSDQYQITSFPGSTQLFIICSEQAMEAGWGLGMKAGWGLGMKAGWGLGMRLVMHISVSDQSHTIKSATFLILLSLLPLSPYTFPHLSLHPLSGQYEYKAL